MTETDIANQALSKIGGKLISDISENMPAAIVCRTHYETVRDSLLRSHPWNFATGRAQLSATTTPVFGWDYAYTLPADFLRLSTYNGAQAAMLDGAYTIEADGLLLSNDDIAKITYVKRITDPTRFDPLFTEVLIYRLGSAIAMEITGEPARRDEMEQLAALRMSSASFVDANERKSSVASPIAGMASRLRGTPEWYLNPPFPPFEG